MANNMLNLELLANRRARRNRNNAIRAGVFNDYLNPKQQRTVPLEYQPNANVVGRGTMSALPPTMTMRAGEVLTDYLSGLRKVFPEANPIGQAIEDFMLQPSEEMAAQMVEGNPYAVFDTRAGQQLINPALPEAVGLVPVGAIAGAIAKTPSTLAVPGLIGVNKLIQKTIENIKTPEDVFSGLYADARKAPSFEAFEKDYTQQIKHGKYYHITEDPNFRIDPEKGASDTMSYSTSKPKKGSLMVTSDLPYWAAGYGDSRKYVAEIDMSDVPRNQYEQVNRGQGNEFFIEDASKAKVKKVVPLEQEIAQSDRYNQIIPQNREELREFYNAAKMQGLLGRTAQAEAPSLVEGLLTAGMGRNPEMDILMTGYHGTPHRFPPTERNPLGEFDLQKIGTGEGAQAYGHGIYVAENPNVAKDYQAIFAQRGYQDNNKNYARALESNLSAGEFDSFESMVRRQGGDATPENLADEFFELNEEWKPLKNNPEEYENIRKFAEDYLSNLPETNLYKVDIPDEVIDNQMLDYDAPLSQQSEEVRQVLEGLELLRDKLEPGQQAGQTGWQLYDKETGFLDPNYSFSSEREALDFLENPTGGDIYEYLSGGNDGAMAADVSALLRSKGISGIKYYDQGSRGKEGGTRNFVLFDPDVATIIGRNGEQLSEIDKARLMPDSLPMDEASRLQRAKEMGFDTSAYHGSTHDIEAFDASQSNPSNDWGKAIYTTSSVDDVNPNYAREGEDLNARIKARQEIIATEKGLPYDDKQALEQARSELVGESEGVVYPLKINTEKYAVIGDDSTYIEMPDYRAEAMEEISRRDYDSEELYEEALQEYIFDLEDADMDHPLLTIKDTLMRTAGDEYLGNPDEVDQAVGIIAEELHEGLTATRLDEIIRDNISGWQDDDGVFFNAGAASAKVLEELGFEGVIDKTVDTKFGSSRRVGIPMKGVTPDTVHVVTFPGYEKNIRSKYAKFDPSKKDSAKILASTVPAILGAGLLSSQQENNNATTSGAGLLGAR